MAKAPVTNAIIVAVFFICGIVLYAIKYSECM
jgi:hypothetical protein